MERKKFKLPEGWKWVKLGEVLEYEQPTKYIVKTENYDKQSGIPVLTPGKTFILGYTDEKDGIFTNVPVIIFDDFTTESKYVSFPFKVKSSALKILKSKGKDILYVLYSILQLLNFKPGGEHKRFWISEYSKLTIPLPPLPEQRKIAEILETVDNAIEKTEKIIEKYKRIKQGLMQELLTKGIDENGNIRSEKTHRFKDSPIGRIPKEWEVVRLGDKSYFEIIMGQSPPSSSYNKKGKGAPFLQGKAEFGSIFPSCVQYTTKPLKVTTTGSILVSVRAPVGDVNIADRDYCIGRGLASVKPNLEKVNNYFLFYLLSHMKPKMEGISGGSTFKAISKQYLQDFPLPLPPLPEQQRIVQILGS